MASGGARARSGPPPQEGSYRSMNRDWVDLPANGFTGEMPNFPLPLASANETELWAELWAKPQAAAWSSLGLKFQVAAYTRAYLESTEAGATSGLKTAVLRMETELGLSVAGMRQNLWRIAEAVTTAPKKAAAPYGKRKTATDTWLSGVSVEGA